MTATTMMTILAIDTTSEHGSIALWRGGKLVEARMLEAPDGFGQVIFQEIAATLGRHEGGLSPFDVDVYACTTGPGAFTGVRIGVAAVKGLAESAGKRVAGVSNLRALAASAGGQSEQSPMPMRAVWIDARRGEIYGAVYTADTLEIVPGFGEEKVLREDAWRFSLAAEAHASPLEFIDGTRLLAELPLAAAVARLVAEGRAQALDPAALDANYVRRSDAELFWKEGND